MIRPIIFWVSPGGRGRGDEILMITVLALADAVKNSHDEVSPSTVFAIASILDGHAYINGSPSNTFVPGCIELAERYGSFIAGDDFKCESCV
jgi:myo-inositol-1-phosphate synthase